MNWINEIIYLISFALHLLKNPSGIKAAFQGKSFSMTHSKTMTAIKIKKGVESNLIEYRRPAISDQRPLMIRDSIM